MSDFVLRGGTVVFPDRAPEPLDVLVQGRQDRRAACAGHAGAGGTPEQSAHGPACLSRPDRRHVHFGFGEKITEYTTETVIRGQGGFTTVLGYFLNNEAYADVFEREQEHARARCHVDYGFHFSTANELHIQELGEYVNDYGVTSFKYFMNFKGEEGRYLGPRRHRRRLLLRSAGGAARVGKPIVVCHTENIEIVNRIRRRSRPRAAAR